MEKYEKKCRDCDAIIDSAMRLCAKCRAAGVEAAREKYRKGRKILRDALVAYKGELKSGGCAICGYNKCSGAIDFHHLSEKGINMSRAISIEAMNIEIMQLANRRETFILFNWHVMAHAADRLT